jgi:hypothetical protein
LRAPKVLLTLAALAASIPAFGQASARPALSGEALTQEALDRVFDGRRALDQAGREVAVHAEADGTRYLNGRPRDALRLYVEAPHYRHRDGRGRGFKVKLDAAAASAAVPF